MPITPGGRYSPNDSDEWDLITDLAAMQVSNETASANDVQNGSNYRVLTNAQRLALSGANLREGMMVWTSDTRATYLYTSGAWVQTDARSSRNTSANQSLSTGSWTTINWPTVLSESGISYSGGTWTFTSPGIYMVTSQYGFATSNTTGQRVIRALVNGTTQAILSQQVVPNSTAYPTIPQIQGALTISAGNTLAIQALQSSGGTINGGISSDLSNVTIRRIG